MIEVCTALKWYRLPTIETATRVRNKTDWVFGFTRFGELVKIVTDADHNVYVSATNRNDKALVRGAVSIAFGEIFSNRPISMDQQVEILRYRYPHSKHTIKKAIEFAYTMTVHRLEIFNAIRGNELEPQWLYVDGVLPALSDRTLSRGQNAVMLLNKNVEIPASSRRKMQASQPWLDGYAKEDLK